MIWLSIFIFLCCEHFFTPEFALSLSLTHRYQEHMLKLKGWGPKDADARGTTRLTSNLVDIPNKGRRLSMDARIENFHVGSSTVATNKIRMRERQILGKSHKEIEEIWLEVLERIQVTGLKEFLFKEGKLISVSFGAGECQIRTMLIQQCN